MATENDIAFDRQREINDTAAALRFLAAATEQERETLFTDVEAYGQGVILRMLADRLDGGADCDMAGIEDDEADVIHLRPAI